MWFASTTQKGEERLCLRRGTEMLSAEVQANRCNGWRGFLSGCAMISAKDGFTVKELVHCDKEIRVRRSCSDPCALRGA